MAAFRAEQMFDPAKPSTKRRFPGYGRKGCRLTL